MTAKQYGRLYEVNHLSLLFNSTLENADMDWGLYKYRHLVHLVEGVFARLKYFCAIATQ